MNSNHDHDLHNTIDVSSSEEDDHNEKIYYDVDDFNADDDTTDDYNVLMDNDNSSTEKSYVILKQDELDKRQQEEIEKVTSVLSISNDDACILLLKYNWSATNVNEAWFEDEVKVRESVGLLDVHHDVKFPKNDEKTVDCGICFDSVMAKDSANCGCGHVFCKVCWEGYVSTAIIDGPGCLNLKCPEPSCGAAVGPDMVKVFAKGQEKKKYGIFWLRSYVESNKKIKWCPGPGCDCAIEFDDDSYDADNYDVTCDCKYVFCWKCMEDDAHSPLNCETVGKWALKNTTDDAQNTNCWILLHTKPCPKCNQPIEKNNGCMMMTCRKPCGYRFCWLCLEPCHYGSSCNGYRTKVVNQNLELAKEALERYTHHYVRWDANKRSRRKALLDLHKIKTTHLKRLSLIYCLPVTQLQFITDAWLQIVECRRVLKWTYVYGYYIPKQEEAKKLFFEYLQGRAEAGLEQLHFCAEKGLRTHINEASLEKFSSFRAKLANLTRVTRSYFEKLVRALENGLSEVDSNGGVRKTNLSSVQGDTAGSSTKVKGQKRSRHHGESLNKLAKSVQGARMTRMRRTLN
ncbi:probable E3 ubiquitin-protein ligase ARI8 [Tanacetum coccineum]